MPCQEIKSQNTIFYESENFHGEPESLDLGLTARMPSCDTAWIFKVQLRVFLTEYSPHYHVVDKWKIFILFRHNMYGDFCDH